MEKFLLSSTPTVKHRLAIDPEKKAFIFSSETTFDLTLQAGELKAFLQHVKDDKSVRHTYTTSGRISDDKHTFEYDPANDDLHKFVIVRTGIRAISFGFSTAWRLLNALNGETERLVREN